VHACELHKRIALQPGSRARAKLVSALADDDQHASDVALVLLASDDGSEAVVLGSAVVNLEGVLECGRDFDDEPQIGLHQRLGRVHVIESAHPFSERHFRFGIQHGVAAHFFKIATQGVIAGADLILGSRQVPVRGRWFGRVFDCAIGD
jgi:hypothetical protein